MRASILFVITAAASLLVASLLALALGAHATHAATPTPSYYYTPAPVSSLTEDLTLRLWGIDKLDTSTFTSDEQELVIIAVDSLDSKSIQQGACHKTPIRGGSFFFRFHQTRYSSYSSSVSWALTVYTCSSSTCTGCYAYTTLKLGQQSYVSALGRYVNFTNFVAYRIPTVMTVQHYTHSAFCGSSSFLSRTWNFPASYSKYCFMADHTYSTSSSIKVTCDAAGGGSYKEYRGQTCNEARLFDTISVTNATSDDNSTSFPDQNCAGTYQISCHRNAPGTDKYAIIVSTNVKYISKYGSAGAQGTMLSLLMVILVAILSV